MRHLSASMEMNGVNVAAEVLYCESYLRIRLHSFCPELEHDAASQVQTMLTFGQAVCNFKFVVRYLTLLMLYVVDSTLIVQ